MVMEDRGDRSSGRIEGRDARKNQRMVMEDLIGMDSDGGYTE